MSNIRHSIYVLSLIHYFYIEFFSSMFFETGLYGADTVADAPGGLIPALQLITHIPLLFSTCLALIRGFMVPGANGFASLVSSVGYHSCRSGLFCLGLDLGLWRIFDHVASLCYGASLVLFAIQYSRASGSGPRIGQFGIVLLPFVCLWSVIFSPFHIHSAMVVMVYVSLFILDRFLLNGRDLNAKHFRQVIYKPWHLLWGTLSLAIAMGGYVLDTGHPRGDALVDGLVHSLLWHTFSGIALCFYIAAFTPLTTTTTTPVDHNGWPGDIEFNNNRESVSHITKDDLALVS